MSKSLRVQFNQAQRLGWGVTCLSLIGFLIGEGSALAADRKPQPLYIMNADGTGLHELTHLVDHQCMGSPMFTRDGKQIMFDAWRTRESSSTAHIYIVNADGTWPKDLGAGAMPTTSSVRRNSLATHYYGDKQGVWIGVGSGLLIDGEAGSPRWHPYEPKLAYVKWSGGIAARDIYGDKIGEEQMLVPAVYRPYVGFSWSPDGKAIAFYSNRNGEGKTELMVMNVDDQNREPEVKAVGKIGWTVAWSPDGKKVAFSNYYPESDTQQIYVVDPTSSAPAVRLEGQDPARHNGGPAWSPDGKQIVFTSTEATAPKKADEAPRAGLEINGTLRLTQ